MTWYRIERRTLDSDTPILWIDFEDLPVFPSAFGLVEFGTAPLPHTVLQARISSSTTLDLLHHHVHRGIAHHPVVATASFPDPHTKQWHSEVHHLGGVLLLVGDTLPLEATYPFPVTQAEVLHGCLAGIAQLAPH
ncbi:hypothetical protein [Williamsia sp. 1135]|uniref:hypothetical protein n=1 Tax=Williamsia sp. 1135 TaxID=1889262 RepID=UPI000A11F53C|nr:hypothetical protein [Williamsia sp. 1135]ORM37783.1 hypothetical protein BFL43_03000 [Williamsia sp. 1135]